MAVGNTFGATALSSYGGFWIAYGILLTPSWNILGQGGPYAAAASGGGDANMGQSALGFFLTGWFIFTTILLLCTLRSTIMFFLLFFTLDLAFLMLACQAYAVDNGAADAADALGKAGGTFGIFAAFFAWYNAFAGIADTRYVVGSPYFRPFPAPSGRPPSIPFVPAPIGAVVGLYEGAAWLTRSGSNSFFLIPVFHFPWSDKAHETRKSQRATV